MRATDYDAHGIQVLEGLEAVRKRPGMYVGDTSDGSGLHNLLWESVDEVLGLHYAGEATDVRIEIANGWIVVRDDGAGIPVDTASPDGAPVLELFFTRLMGACHRSTGVARYLPTGGMHGAGMAAVNALCERFEVETTRAGIRWTQAYERGKCVTHVRRAGPTALEGTAIRFRPDPLIFTSVDFDLRAIAARLQELAWLHPSLRVHFQERRLYGRGGLAGWTRELAAQRGAIEVSFDVAQHVEDVRVDIAFAWNDHGPPVMRSFVNTHPMISDPHINAVWPGFAMYAQFLASPARSQAHVREAIGCGLVATMHVQLPDPWFTSIERNCIKNEKAADAVRVAIYSSLATGTFAWAAQRFVQRRLLVYGG